MRRTGKRPLSALSLREKQTIAAELLEMAGPSGYRPHLLVTKGAETNAEWISILREAVDLLPDNPFLHDRLSTTLVGIHKQASLEADIARKSEQAAESLKSAEAALERFKPKTEWGEKRAAALREDLRLARERLRPERD